jgi:hypothetical protein
VRARLASLARGAFYLDGCARIDAASDGGVVVASDAVVPPVVLELEAVGAAAAVDDALGVGVPVAAASACWSAFACGLTIVPFTTSPALAIF